MKHALIRKRLVAVTLLALLGLAAAANQPPKPRPAAEPDFALWLVRVQYCHRLDRSMADAAGIGDLEKQRDSAATPAEKRKIQREIDKLESAANENRGHVIYGWSVQADDAGKPLDSTRAMTGFLLPATPENNKAIAALREADQRRKPATIAIRKEGAADLFTFSGRRWHRAERAAIVKNPADIGDPGAFDIPPDKPITATQKASIETSLTFERSEERDTGNTLHRYAIKINGEQPPAGVATLHIWFAVHFGVNDVVIGPIIDHIEVPRSSKGTFTMTRSFEFVARAGTRMDAKATTATPIAIAWK